MDELLKTWLLPLPVFAPDDEGAGGGEGGDDTTTETETDTTAETDKESGDKGGGAQTAMDADLDNDDTDKAPPADWPEDWREKLASGDKDAEKLLKRFGSPAGLMKKLLNQEQLIRSGKVKQDMPDPEDADAMKAWRKAEGIPDDPTGYAIPDTVKAMVTDDDKPMLASFTEFAHAKNAPQQVVDLATEWYFSTMDEISSKQAATDKEASDATVEEMRQEYGPEYKANMELGRGFMEITPEIGKDWMFARLPDGRMLGNIPEFIRFAVDQGRAQFGDTAFATPDAEQKHNGRKAEIEQIMNTDIDRYRAEGLDREYQQILDREAKRGKRAA